MPSVLPRLRQSVAAGWCNPDSSLVPLDCGVELHHCHVSPASLHLVCHGVRDPIAYALLIPIFSQVDCVAGHLRFACL